MKKQTDAQKFYSDLAKTIKKAQIDRDLSNDELAVIGRMSKSTFYRKIGSPDKFDIGELFKLAQRLNLNISIEQID